MTFKSHFKALEKKKFPKKTEQISKHQQDFRFFSQLLLSYKLLSLKYH